MVHSSSYLIFVLNVTVAAAHLAGTSRGGKSFAAAFLPTTPPSNKATRFLLGAASASTHRPPSSAALCGDSLEGDDFRTESVTLTFGSRRGFVLSHLFGTGAFVLGQTSQPALAAYGESSNIELPNYIEFLIEKNKTVDPNSILYKGADSDVLLKRLGDATAQLNKIPPLAEAKKWSQVQGILTGPLGTLVQTMNQVLTSAGGKEEVKDAAKKVKMDLFDISSAAVKKSDVGCVGAVSRALNDLESFVKMTF